jgi:hypothetical protein
MDPMIDSKMKTPDVGISMLEIKCEAKATEHNSLAE